MRPPGMNGGAVLAMLLLGGMAASPSAGAAGAASTATVATGASDELVTLYAAGSLTGALGAVAQQYRADTGGEVATVFGPSGLLRERIEQGAPADVFASADLAGPQRLFGLGMSSPPVLFVRNRLCATARAELRLAPENLLDKLLDPAVKLGTSAPKADPGGDYAWQLFALADKARPGARAILEAKARQLVGGPSSPALPPGARDAAAYYFDNGKVDVFLGYCSARQPIAKRAAEPGIDRVGMPPQLAVSPEYGVTVVNRAGQPRAAAYRFALYMLGAKAQGIMAEYGFVPLNLPAQAD